MERKFTDIGQTCYTILLLLLEFPHVHTNMGYVIERGRHAVGMFGYQTAILKCFQNRPFGENCVVTINYISIVYFLPYNTTRYSTEIGEEHIYMFIACGNHMALRTYAATV